MSPELARVQKITEHAQAVADIGRRIVAELAAASALGVDVRAIRLADYTAKLHRRAQRLADLLHATPSPRPARKARRGHTPNGARTWPRPSVSPADATPPGGPRP